MKKKSTISQSVRWPLQVSCFCCPKPKEIHFTVIKNGKSNLVAQAGTCRNYFPNYQTFHLSQKERQRTIVLFCFFPRLAGDVSEPGLCSGEEESDLLSSHQRRENSCCRDPHPPRAAVQEERLPVHLTVHITGAGEGTVTQGNPHTVKKKNSFSLVCKLIKSCFERDLCTFHSPVSRNRYISILSNISIHTVNAPPTPTHTHFFKLRIFDFFLTLS